MKNVYEIEIELKGKEWSDILDDTFKNKQKDLKLDGFRKGQVPKDTYIKKFGLESLFMDAVDAALPVAYNKLLSEKNLIPVIEPKVEIKHICDADVTFAFTITTKPEVKLGEYKNLKLKKETAKVTEEEIDAEIESIRTKMADLIVVEDVPVKYGHTVTTNFKGFVDGKELEGGSGENFPLEIGSNTFIPGFEEGLIGMRVNEEKELNLKFPEEYVENLKNKDVLFKVKVVEIKERVLPELNEELYKDMGYEDVKTLEDFRKMIESDLKQRKEKELDDKYLDQVLNKAIENLKVEVNDEIVDDEVERMIKQYGEQLQYQGMNLEKYYEITKTTEEDLKNSMKEEALKRIKSRYLLEAIVEEEKIEVTDDEVSEEAEKLAMMYQMTKEELLKAFGGLEMMKYDVKMRKAIDILRK